MLPILMLILFIQTARQAPYKGLHRVAGEAKWEVRIEVQGSIKLLGQYRDAREAATAHDAAVLVAGTDAPLNFPDEVSQWLTVICRFSSCQHMNRQLCRRLHAAVVCDHSAKYQSAQLSRLRWHGIDHLQHIPWEAAHNLYSMQISVLYDST